MDKKDFYREQGAKFIDYLLKNHKRDIFCLFDTWVKSKDFSEEDKRSIWKLVKIYLIKENNFKINHGQKKQNRLE